MLARNHSAIESLPSNCLHTDEEIQTHFFAHLLCELPEDEQEIFDLVLQDETNNDSAVFLTRRVASDACKKVASGAWNLDDVEAAATKMARLVAELLDEDLSATKPVDAVRAA